MLSVLVQAINCKLFRNPLGVLCKLAKCVGSSRKLKSNPSGVLCELAVVLVTSHKLSNLSYKFVITLEVDLKVTTLI